MTGVPQISLFAGSVLEYPPAVAEAVEALRSDGGTEERGAVFTAPEIVEAILDLVGYTSDQDLELHRVLEPSFGGGDFLLPVVRRLFASLERRGLDPSDHVLALSHCLRAVELHRYTFRRTRHALGELLLGTGLAAPAVESLLNAWLINDDYLLTDGLGEFDVVVGNPPYVRQERIPKALLAIYRDRYSTFVSRADLYVLFYEKGLGSLTTHGRLGFICANRWVRNQYGGALRSLVGNDFQLQFFIDLERANAFKKDVIAYPAITVIRRSSETSTVLAHGSRDSLCDLGEIVAALIDAAENETPSAAVTRVRVVRPNRDPWLLDAPQAMAELRALEERFPPLEEAGAKVGIGVATGADRVFVRPLNDLPVEDSRKLPLAMAADCKEGRIEWAGMGVLNPFMDDGSLAPLADFPRLRAYLLEHEEVLRARHVAKQRPERWYKTIDRISPALLTTPKLLIPDIKGDAAITYDPGEFYPHHNLYVVTGTDWDTLALMTLLKSSVALAFVGAYSPRMSGGFLRFQAQYLRRIRCPRWNDLTEDQRTDLTNAAFDRQKVCDDIVFDAMDLDDSARRVLRDYADSVRIRRAGV